MGDDIKSRIPGEWWARATHGLPPARETGPCSTVEDVPGFGIVRFELQPYQYGHRKHRAWAWQIVRAEVAER